MSLSTYSDLQAAIGNWLDHSIFAARYPDFIQLFEATANRRLRTRAMEATTILIPSSPAAINVTNAANNGSGLIRLTIASTATLSTGNECNVANVGGTTEANGTWLVTVIDGSNVDLVGSTFTNAYVSGGTIQGQSGWAALPADYLTWRRLTWTGATRVELGYVNPSYFQAAYPSQPADVPRIFTIEGANLKVMPINATPLEFDYYQKIPGLAASSTNWLMTAHPDLYLFGSMVEAEAFGVNDERMPMWKARRDEIFDEIIKLDTKTRGPSFVRVFGVTP
jgi:hypothetical protein